MKNLKNFICVGVLATIGFTVSASTIFNNGALYNGNQFTVNSGQPIGNQVTLGSGIFLTNFMFEYYTPDPSLNVNLGVDVRFYKNDGPVVGGYATPGSLFYDSGFFFNTLGNWPVGSNDISFASSDLYSSSLPGAFNLNSGLPGNVLPSDFTFVITFVNVGGNTVQLPLANNSAGVNYGTYWLFDTGWALMTNNTTAANFVVDFAGTVPEPSMFALSALGGALLLGANKLRRKR